MTTQAKPLPVETPSDREVLVTRIFNAPRSLVWDCHTKPELVRRWLLGPPGWSMPLCEIDLRVGGKYSLEMHHKDGNIHNLSGTYEEVKPPEKLAFTWRWQQDETATESLVTVTFKDLGGSTEVSLTHKNLLTAEAREKHNQGWIGCFTQLDSYLA